MPSLTTGLTDIRLGSAGASKVYRGATMVWQRALRVDWLAIGGGGAGYYNSGDTSSWGGKAGGAGGQVHGSDVWLPGTTKQVTIGAGASKANATQRNGASTTLEGYTPAKGGYGGNGVNGTSASAASGDTSQGYAGGARVGTGNNSGGGGGAGTAGYPTPDGTNGGPGGDGYLWLDGNYYGPGGGGGSRAGSTSVAHAGLGTYDNNGEGGRWDNGGNGGTANKGGGGGGGGGASGYGNSDSGSGGSGVVIVRYPAIDINDTKLTYTGTQTITFADGYIYHTLKGSGTITVNSTL